jgi:hypothetical protein
MLLRNINSKQTLNCNRIYFLFILFLCTPLIACKSNSESEKAVKNSVSMNDDKSEITLLINKLNSDYKSISTMYELDMEPYAKDNPSYVKKYSDVLNNMHYVSDAFKKKLISKIQGIEIPSSVSNIRPMLDPLFQAEFAADEIVIQGIDIEDNMASIGINLYDSYDKITSSYTDLIFDKDESGKWKLTGNEISKASRERHPTTIEVEKIMGLYLLESDDSKGYGIKKSDQNYVLEYCHVECDDIGKIEKVLMPKIGTYHIKLEGISGEIGPRFSINNSKMEAHEYNAEEDKWEDNTYLFSQGEG